MRTDICASDDYETRERLLIALGEVGASSEGDWESFGVGLHRFRIGFDVLTVFIDAWTVDLEGPDKLVQRVIEQGWTVGSAAGAPKLKAASDTRAALRTNKRRKQIMDAPNSSN